MTKTIRLSIRLQEEYEETGNIKAKNLVKYLMVNNLVSVKVDKLDLYNKENNYSSLSLNDLEIEIDKPIKSAKLNYLNSSIIVEY